MPGSRQVPISQHTSDSYARLANERLKLSGHDVEGAYFSQPQFQVRCRASVLSCLTSCGTERLS